MATKVEEVQVVPTTVWSAGPGCHGGCGVLAHIGDGKLIKIEGNANHPWNQGRLCARVLAMNQYVEHPDRLRHPLKRVGERGEGKWEKISWDEALDLIERRLKAVREEYAPESVVFAAGTGRDIYSWLCMLAYAFGSPNVMFALSGNACYAPRLTAVRYTCQIACCQEYGWEAGMSGMQIIEQVQNLPKGKAYLTYLPFPTELCVLCAPRTKKGLRPACAQHCMADVIRWGRLDDLAGQLGEKPRMVLWSPR